MKISDIRNPLLFQRLVHRLLIADRGIEFQIPDDSGGDRGNDGYDSGKEALYAIYCPSKPDTADYRAKALADLRKAAMLAKEPGYTIRLWIFVTPSALRESLQAEIRSAATSFGLSAAFMADAHLEDLLRRYPHIRDEAPTLEYPQVARQLDAMRAPLSPLRAFITLESHAAEDDLQRVFSNYPGFRQYGGDKPLPPPPMGPPDGSESCRLFHSDSFMDFEEGRLVGAGVLHLMGIEYPHIHRPAIHTVCSIPRPPLLEMADYEPLCMHPDLTIEVSKLTTANPANPSTTISFRAAVNGSPSILRLFAIDSIVLADFLTAPMTPSPADASMWSLYDLSGAELRITLTFFYIDGVNSIPQQSWPRLESMNLVVGNSYVLSVPKEVIDRQMHSQSTAFNIASGASTPSIELKWTIPSEGFREALSPAIR